MRSKPTFLLCTSNGVGLGHLSRVMGVAQHLRSEFDIVIFTLSAAVSIPIEQGFRTEYLRSHEYSEFDGSTWNRLLERRLEHLHEMYKPALVSFDGTHPYAGLCRYLHRHREVFRVWERRGMWRAGQGKEAMLRARHFDLVVEPGDYARDYDVGVTSTITHDVHRVSPVLYRGVPLSRQQARAELALDTDAQVALLQLGAGQINDVDSLIRRAVDLLRDAAVQVVVASSVLSASPDIDIPGVSVVKKYPISDYFAAFDMGFFAGGYNSFHEALSLRLPSVFVPNPNTKLDDQSARTRFAHDHGYGLDWSDGERSTLERLVERLLDPAERNQIRERMRTLPPANGAAEIAALLRNVVVHR